MFAEEISILSFSTVLTYNNTRRKPCVCLHEYIVVYFYTAMDLPSFGGSVFACIIQTEDSKVTGMKNESLWEWIQRHN